MSATEQNIVVVADVVAKPGHEETLHNALHSAVKNTRSKDGCILFRLHQDTTVPGHFILYEVWRDLAAIDAHQSSAQFAELLRGAKEITQSSQIYRLNSIAE